LINQTFATVQVTLPGVHEICSSLLFFNICWLRGGCTNKCFKIPAIQKTISLNGRNLSTSGNGVNEWYAVAGEWQSI
jgi:hypothetical protein